MGRAARIGTRASPPAHAHLISDKFVRQPCEPSSDYARRRTVRDSYHLHFRFERTPERHADTWSSCSPDREGCKGVGGGTRFGSPGCACDREIAIVPPRPDPLAPRRAGRMKLLGVSTSFR